MTGRIAAVVAIVVCFPMAAHSEVPSLGDVTLVASRSEVTAPGMLGVEVRLRDSEGRALRPRALPPSWQVRVTSDGSPLWLELTPSSVGPFLEGDLRLRDGSESGVSSLAAEVVDRGQTLGTSPPVELLAVSAHDVGTVRAGETACRELPGGGRGLRGAVIDGALPPGVRLWGACIVAEDDADRAEGTIRAAIDVLSGSGAGRRVERRIYDITFRTEPRIVTPRRALYGFGALSLLVMLAGVGFSVRTRGEHFGHGAVVAWTEVRGSPYRGDRLEGWRVTSVDCQVGRRGVDLAPLLGLSALGKVALRMRPTEDGRVEITVPRRENLRALTPTGETVVSRRRVVVPFGSVVAFRDFAIAPLIGDEAAAAARGRSDLFLPIPAR